MADTVTISRRSAEVLLAQLGGDWRAYTAEELETAKRELKEKPYEYNRELGGHA